MVYGQSSNKFPNAQVSDTTKMPHALQLVPKILLHVSKLRFFIADHYFKISGLCDSFQLCIYKSKIIFIDRKIYSLAFTRLQRNLFKCAQTLHARRNACIEIVCV